MDVRPAFVPDAQTAQAVEPGQRALHDPPMPPQPLARLDPLAGNARGDPAPAQGLAVAPGVIGFVGVQLGRAAPRAAERAADGRDGVHHRLEEGALIYVGGGQARDQGNTLAVGQDVVFAAGLGAVGRVRARRGPPFLAGTLAASRAARDQSIRSWMPNRSSRWRWRASQMPASCQSRRRRQQVIPLPHPISWGKYSQGRPVLSTNRIPVSAARSETRGRPPLGLGDSGGSNGAISCQSRSVSRGLATLVVYHNALRFC